MDLHVDEYRYNIGIIKTKFQQSFINRIHKQLKLPKYEIQGKIYSENKSFICTLSDILYFLECTSDKATSQPILYSRKILTIKLVPTY